jgi:hypothetical protein
MDLGLSFLDRQIVDKDDRPCGTVDDLELEWPRDGKGAPYVSAILAGPGAMSKRLGGRLGRWIGAVHKRLNHGDPTPARIAIGIVKRVGVKVELIVGGDDVETSKLQKWVLDKMIAQIPGAEHAPE